jgi:GTP-binding protein
MMFSINNSPFYGKDGKFVTSRHLRDRLYKETEKNLALRVQDSPSADSWLVFGRGVLHLSILIETMRREGYELQVGQPKVIIKEVDGVKCEPIEFLTINVKSDFSGRVIDVVTTRKGEIIDIENRGDRTRLEFSIPARGLFGLRNVVLTATEGESVISHRFKGFEPIKGDMPVTRNGALIAMETGQAIAYSLNRLQDRGHFFVEPFENVYAGQVIGEHIRQDDLIVNVVITKKMSNMRASGSDDKAILVPPRRFSLEEAMEYLSDDEQLEVTPLALRLRKTVLDHTERKRLSR